ncbi:MAG: hypothetical protein HQL20_02085 [Candidatus Omnitrophica bacterium]|nr:hypothetical protein [Candidatus Omnitrophota bacterium]
MKLISLILFMCVGLTISSYADEKKDESMFYEKLKNISRPIVVEQMGQYRDGGTLYVVLTGPGGEKLSFCLNRDKTFPFGRLFVNAISASSADAQIVPRGSLLEKLTIEVFKEWLNQNIIEAVYKKQWEDRQKMLGILYCPDNPLATHKYYVSKIIESLQTSAPERVEIKGAVRYRESK